MIETTLQTERTVLRMFTPEDLDALASIFGNANVMKYLGHDCQPIPREETETAILSMIKHWKERNFGRWAVIEKESNRLIGCAGFRSYEDTAELFYILDEPFWGKGFATEIAQECVRFGFEERDFDRIVAFTRLGNTASRNVLNKIGLNLQGNIKIFDIEAVQYVIKREDYKS